MKPVPHSLLTLGVQLLFGVAACCAGENNTKNPLIAGMDASDRKDYDAAIKYYTEYIRSKPGEKEPLALRAYTYKQMGDLDHAIADFSEIIRIAPNDAEAYNSRGSIHLRKREYDLAMADFNEAVRLRPKAANYYLDRAAINEVKGEDEKALADCSAAIRLDPRWVMPYCRRGDIHERMGESDKAIADYSEAIKARPNFARAYGGRGHSYEIQGEYEKAIADLSKGIELDPKDPYIPNDLAWIRATCPEERIRDGKEAVRLATKACELMKRASAVDTLAAAYAEAGKFSKAIEFEQEALKTSADAAVKKQLEARLELFKNGKLFRDETKR